MAYTLKNVGIYANISILTLTQVNSMQSNAITPQELKSILLKTETYKQAKNASSLKFKCSEYTDKLYKEIKDVTPTIRVSVNFGDHWFLLCNTSDGIIIVDPTYSQTLKSISDDYPFFIGTREKLWKLAKKDEQSLTWFNYQWPVNARVPHNSDMESEEIQRIFITDNLFQVKTGNEIEIKQTATIHNAKLFKPEKMNNSEKEKKKKKDQPKNTYVGSDAFKSEYKGKK